MGKHLQFPFPGALDIIKRPPQASKQEDFHCFLGQEQSTIEHSQQLLSLSLDVHQASRSQARRARFTGMETGSSTAIALDQEHSEMGLPPLNHPGFTTNCQGGHGQSMRSAGGLTPGLASLPHPPTQYLRDNRALLECITWFSAGIECMTV